MHEAHHVPAAPDVFVVQLRERWMVRSPGCAGVLIEQPVHRHFQSTREFIKCLYGRDCVAILHPRDIAAHQTGALLNISLGKILTFTQNAQAFSDYHVFLPEMAPSPCRIVLNCDLMTASYRARDVYASWYA